jgi:hypothetical protein
VRNQFFKIGSANMFDVKVALADSDQSPGKKSGKSRHQRRKRRADGTLKTEPFKVFHGLTVPIALRELPKCNTMLLEEWRRCKNREKLSTWWLKFTIPRALAKRKEIPITKRYCNDCMRRRKSGSETYSCQDCSFDKDVMFCSLCGIHKWYTFPVNTVCPIHGEPGTGFSKKYRIGYLRINTVLESYKRYGAMTFKAVGYPFDEVAPETSELSAESKKLRSCLAKYESFVADPIKAKEEDKYFNLDFAKMKVNNLKGEIIQEDKKTSRKNSTESYVEFHIVGEQYSKIRLKDMVGPR